MQSGKIEGTAKNELRAIINLFDDWLRMERLGEYRLPQSLNTVVQLIVVEDLHPS